MRVSFIHNYLLTLLTYLLTYSLTHSLTYLLTYNATTHLSCYPTTAHSGFELAETLNEDGSYPL